MEYIAKSPPQGLRYLKDDGRFTSPPAPRVRRILQVDSPL
jgi:hypothetical protein